MARVLGDEYPTRLVCVALGVARATLLRPPKAVADKAVIAPRIAVRKLTQAERYETLALLHSDRFADRSPGQVVAVLLEQADTYALKARRTGSCASTVNVANAVVSGASRIPQTRALGDGTESMLVLGHYEAPWS